MGSLFDQDRAFWRFLNKFSDIVILNVVFIICCIPIVTIGPAYTALYYTLVKTVRKGRGYAIKNFLHSFKQNLFQGITAWMLCLVGLCGCGVWIYLLWVNSENGGSAQIGFWLLIIIAVIFLAMVIYLFPILSRFEMSLKNLFVFAYIMTIRFPINSIALLLLLAIFLAAAYLCIPLLVIILPALYVFIASFIIEKIFKVYMPKFEARIEPEAVQNDANDDELKYLGAAAEKNAENLSDGDEEKKFKDQWYYE
jgi:uncharacterized membrane protein YesL